MKATFTFSLTFENLKIYDLFRESKVRFFKLAKFANYVKNYFAEIQVDKVYFTIFSQEFIWSEKISRMKDCHPFKSRPKYDIVKKKKKSAMFLFSPLYSSVMVQKRYFTRD